MKAKRNIEWIKVCVSPRLINADYQDTIKEKYNYLFLYEDENAIDSTWREFYNIGLYKQESWYPIEQWDLEKITDFLKTKNNVQIINLDELSPEDKLVKAYQMWRLIEEWFNTWTKVDEETRHYTAKEGKRRKEIEKDLWDIVWRYNELENFIPYPIHYQ